LEKALLVEKKVKKAGARKRNECHTIANARGVHHVAGGAEFMSSQLRCK
jgi:hypothetical protein